jgi:hypothetical protein
MKFKPMKSFMLYSGDVEIYFFHVYQNFIYLKYGKNDYVESMSFNPRNFDYDKVKGLEEISLSHEGMKDIPQRIIKDIFNEEDITIEMVQRSKNARD